MNTPKNPAALLAAILSGFATGKVEVAALDLDSNLSVEEQINAIGEKLAAEHREECDDCRAEYEAEQKAKEGTAGLGMEAERPHRDLDALQEKVKARHEAERTVLENKHQAERESLAVEVLREKSERARFTGMKPEMMAPYGQPMTYLVRAGALRQFRHNNATTAGEGFVFGYDKEVTDRVVDTLLKKIAALNTQSRNIGSGSKG